MERKVGTVSRGIRCPIIRQGDDLAAIVANSVIEAAEIEGANALQVFFKITLPMLTPMILLNIVYTVIDIFSDFGNTIIQMIYNTAFESVRFGYSSALSILYFIMVGVVLILVYMMMNKVIVRPEE